MRMRLSVVIGLGLVMLIGMSRESSGQTETHTVAYWANPEGGEFFNNWNWSPSDQDPSMYDSLGFNLGSSTAYPVIVTRGGSVNSLWVENDKVNLVLSPGMSGINLTAGGVGVSSSKGGTGYLKVDMGTLHTMCLMVGGDTTSSATLVNNTEIAIYGDASPVPSVLLGGGHLIIQNGGKLYDRDATLPAEVCVMCGDLTVKGENSQMDVRGLVGIAKFPENIPVSGSQGGPESLTGYLNIEDDAFVHGGSMCIGQGLAEMPIPWRGNVNIDGRSKLNIDDSFIVGQAANGEGVMNIKGESRVSTPAGGIIGDSKGKGTVNITGEFGFGNPDADDMEWMVGGRLSIGYNHGEGHLNLTRMGRVQCREMEIGASGIGTMEIAGGSHVFVDESTSLGCGGKGSVDLRGLAPGASIVDPPFDSDVRSHWILSGPFSIGSGGEGKLLVQEGASLHSSGVTLGDDPNSIAEVTITGNYSNWINTSDIRLGKGQVSLTVKDKGYVESSSQLRIEGNNGSNGSVYVQDAGSKLASTTIVVGGAEKGFLAVENGGSVESTNGIIAGSSGSEGYVTVSSGTGINPAATHWTISDNLYMGGFGVIEMNVYTEGGKGNLKIEGKNSVVKVGKKVVLGDQGVIDVTSGGLLTIGNMEGINLGSIGSANIVIGKDGTLEGTGTVHGTVLNRGGILRPGHSPGVIHLDSLIQEGGKIILEVSGSGEGQYDQIDVQGELNLCGTVEFVFLNGYQPQSEDKFQFLKAGTLTGTPNVTVDPASEVQVGQVLVENNTVTFVPASEPTPTQTPTPTPEITPTPTEGPTLTPTPTATPTPTPTDTPVLTPTPTPDVTVTPTPTDTPTPTPTSTPVPTVTISPTPSETPDADSDEPLTVAKNGFCGSSGLMLIVSTVLAGLWLTGTRLKN